jgi:ribose 5-phosphate isomerase B
MKIAVTTDHAGYEALKELKVYIENLGHEVLDFGPKVFDADDDYPDFMFPAAQSVASGECEVAIILGGSGQGEAMAANRVKGVRAAVFYAPAIAVEPIDAEGNKSTDPYEIVKLSRQHNHANILSLSGRFLTLDQMKNAIKIWLDTPYSEAERHARRVKQLDQ